MYAQKGDRLIVPGPHIGDSGRDGEIVEVSHADGGPPYLVQWSDTGHQALVFPGPDAHIEHFDDDPPDA
jgi:hypothetical protein